MKRIFESLTRIEYEMLKAHYLAGGMHERVFYNLKKRKEITVSFLNALYNSCGITYDYKTGSISRVDQSPNVTMEEIDAILDQHL